MGNISDVLFSSSHTGAHVTLSDCMKEELKARLCKIVVGKDRCPKDRWRSGEPAVRILGCNEDLHQAKVVAHEVFEQNRAPARGH